MIWNKKKQNSLLITEMLISFLVLFAVFTLLVFNYRNFRKPMGFDYENLWLVTYNNAEKTSNLDSLNIFYETLRQSIQSLPSVKKISFLSDNAPFTNNMSTTSIDYKNKHIKQLNLYTADDYYLQAMDARLLEGRWFRKEDAVYRNEPVVINESTKIKLFGDEPAVGKSFARNDESKRKLQIIGVVQDIKMKGDYQDPGAAMFSRPDTAAFRWLGRILIRVTPDAGAAFEGKLYKVLSNSMPQSNVEIEHLADKRKNINYFALVPMIVLLIVAGFLVINVALGLFGVLWYNINRRRGEIGLRRAVGATGRSVTWQLVGEAMVVASIALIVGAFFAVQFPLLNVFDISSKTYLLALGLSIVFIYLLVLVCALYPGKQAAAIFPAVALHED